MASPYHFDKRQADAAVEFFPRFLKLVEAEWAGRTFQLAEWQKKHTREIFGWRRRDGTRRYRRVRGWVPKKNGKSEWAAGLAHLLCVGDGEPGAFVPVYATDRKQAGIIFDKASRMIALDADERGQPGQLARLYEVTKTGLFCPALMASIVPQSGDPTGKHGPAPHSAIGDEVHEWSSGKLHRFLAEGMASRRQPIDLTISTAGTIKTYAHELYQESRAILADPTLDPECYVFIHEAEAEADWTDPAVWMAANPNFGISPKSEFLASQCRLAQRNPRLENDFRRYHLNQWVEQDQRWLPMTKWPANTTQPGDANYWKKLPELMRGRPCFDGIDLGSTSDLSAKVSIFPPLTDGDRVVLIPRFWMPADNVASRDKPEHPYKRWVAEGAVEVTPGNVTDYDFITEACVQDAGKFLLKKIGIDILYQAMQVAIKLQEYGLPVESVRQGYLTLGGPTAELERLFNAGRLEHGNHPVLHWMFGNATYRKDPKGNILPDKARAAEKIDGVTATIMGLGLMNAAKAPPSYKIYIF